MSERRTDDATLIKAVRTLARDIQTEDGVIGLCLAEAAARLETLVEERRWIPVGERLPEDEECVEAAGPWGEDIAWWDGEQWIDFDGETFDEVVTHWRKRGPGPKANG